ncbi:MAG: lysozyme inhibitor LprI family protein [Reyranellaceae bacterium]
MRNALAILIAALPVVFQAQAQPNPADARTLQACLDREEDKLGRDCIGIIADPCLKSADTSDKAKICSSRELAVWEAQLDAALKKVKKGSFKEIDRAVAKSQEAWRTSLKELCPIFGKVDPGTLPGNATYCLLHETASRALLLRRLGEAVNEH